MSGTVVRSLGVRKAESTCVGDRSGTCTRLRYGVGSSLAALGFVVLPLPLFIFFSLLLKTFFFLSCAYLVSLILVDLPLHLLLFVENLQAYLADKRAADAEQSLTLLLFSDQPLPLLICYI